MTWKNHLESIWKSQMSWEKEAYKSVCVIAETRSSIRALHVGPPGFFQKVQHIHPAHFKTIIDIIDSFGPLHEIKRSWNQSASQYILKRQGFLCRLKCLLAFFLAPSSSGFGSIAESGTVKVHLPTQRPCKSKHASTYNHPEQNILEIQFWDSV